MLIDATTTIADITTEQPATVRVFQRHGIDFCCGGKKRLSAACEERGLSVDAVLLELQAASLGTSAEPRLRDLGVTQLIHHLLARYHEPAYVEFDRISAMVERVHAVHRDKAPEQLDALRVTWFELCDELVGHFRKEELVLFPLLEKLEAEHELHLGPELAQGPIAHMLTEHDHAGVLLKRIRVVCENFVAPTYACATWRALWQGLAEFERELMQHIHIENDVLFPKILNPGQR